MIPQLQYFWEQGPVFTVKEWIKNEEHNDCVVLLEGLGTIQSLLLIFCGNFINLSALLQGKHKQQMQIKL